MKQETIYESASDTAKKVRKALKSTFPNTKFSVRSSNYAGGCSVDVSWTDGATSKQVDKVLDQFSSASFDGMQDMKITTGYLYEGKKFKGADYVMGQRNLSPEYRQAIEDQAYAMFADYDTNAWNSNREFNEAELELLKLTDSEYHDPNNTNTYTSPETNDIIEDSLTPEQRLKLTVITQLFDNEQIAQFIADGISIDVIFTKMAELTYNKEATHN